jgi:hypothetical protein
MEQAYDAVAGELGHGCAGCPDNCCDSYFLHHTYIEWCYLWLALDELEAPLRERLIGRAREYEKQSREMLKDGQRPKLMCPLNEEGRCVLYAHRLMVCRTHGVPAELIRPDGKKLSFPGCFRCQELVAGSAWQVEQIPKMERTRLLQRLAILEQTLLDGKRHLMPKVKRTIASMLVEGPPQRSHCADLFSQRKVEK